MPLLSYAEAIAFDLEGTLCNQEEAKARSLEYLSTILIKHPSRRDAFLASYRLHEPRLYRAVISNSITIEEYQQQRFELPIAANGIRLPSENSIAAINKMYMKKCNEEVQLYPEALSVLQALYRDNTPLALITNGPSEIQRAKIRTLNIGHYFDAILISGEQSAAKPDIRIFMKASFELHVNVREMLMVGDSMTEDYNGALKSGAQALLVDREGRAAGHKSINRITNLKELTA